MIRCTIPHDAAIIAGKSHKRKGKVKWIHYGDSDRKMYLNPKQFIKQYEN